MKDILGEWKMEATIWGLGFMDRFKSSGSGLRVSTFLQPTKYGMGCIYIYIAVNSRYSD